MRIPAIRVTFLALMVPVFASAQTTGGTLTGRVSDPEDRPLAGVEITATHVASGSTRTAKTAIDGRYRFYSMAIGMYEVEAELPRHLSVAARKVEVALGTSTRVDMRLRPTEDEEQMTITAPARFLESTAAIGIVVPRELLTVVPLRDRDGTEFATTAPFFSLRAIGETMTNGATAVTPIPLDAIEQVNITTRQYPAEYGRASGGVIRIGAKVGAYEYEGSVFAHARNRSGGSQWGASGGGPIVKERSHFFAAVEDRQSCLSVTGESDDCLSSIVALDGDVSSRHFVHADYRYADRADSTLLRDVWQVRSNLWNDLVLQATDNGNELRDSISGSVMTVKVRHDWTAGAMSREGHGSAFFVQDEVIIRKFAWNVGVRYDDGFSPRVATIYDVNGSGRNLVRASFGRYRNPDTNDAAIGYSYQINPWVALNADALRTSPANERARNALAVSGRVQFSTIVSVIGSYTFSNVPRTGVTPRHFFEAAGIVRLPRGYWISGIGGHRSSLGPEPRETEIDLRLAKTFEFGRGYSLDVMVDGFDVFRRGRSGRAPAEQVGLRVNF